MLLNKTQVCYLLSLILDAGPVFFVAQCCLQLFFGVFLSLWLLSDERRATNDGVGRDAAADANEEHHGVRQHEEGVLHIHPQHYSGGC